MKKAVLFVGALMLSTGLFAQKATAENPFSLEGLINYNSSTLSFSSPSVRLRYFLNDNLALRLQVGIDNSSTKDYAYELANNEGAEGIAITKMSSTVLGLGGEYHFTGTDRLSPYIAAQFNMGFGAMKENFENHDGVSYVADYTRESKAPTLMLGGLVGAGVDIYLIENLYLGLELGLNMSTMTTKVGESTVTAGGTTTESKSPQSKSSSFNTGAVGTFRLGWRF